MIKIKCPNCGSSNPGQAAFCTECGSSLAEAKIICPNCGGENDNRARFCMACGSKLDRELFKAAEETDQEDRAVFVKEDVQDFPSETEVLSQDISSEKELQSQDIPSEKEVQSQDISSERELQSQGSASEDEVGVQDQSSTIDNKSQKDFSGLSVDANETDKGRYEETSFTEEAVNEERFRDFQTDPAEGSKEEGSKEGAAEGKTGKKKKTIFVILGLAAAALIVMFFALNSSPKMASLEVVYHGDTAAGTVLDKSNRGIRVIGVDQDGEKYELTDWTIEDPQTLEMDSSATVTIIYKDLSRKLTVDCSTSELVGISATYNGDAEAGVVLDSDNEGFEVTASYRNGEEQVVTGWTIEEPKTLAADSTAAVVIDYEGKQCSLDVICTTISIEKIKAEYSGSTKAGVEIGEGSSDVTVSAVYKNGETQEVTGWTVDEPVTLEAGKTSKLKIHYGDHDCTLKIECTDMSAKQYKAKCKTYSYDEIARDPDDYKGKKAKFSGTVLQVVESDDSRVIGMRVAKDDDYDHVIYVMYLMPEGASRILEDDTITVYGELAGLYSYTSTMNATITIPLIYAEYVD